MGIRTVDSPAPKRPYSSQLLETFPIRCQPENLGVVIQITRAAWRARRSTFRVPIEFPAHRPRNRLE